MIEALLAKFTGLAVESSCNTMDYILEDDRYWLTTYKFESPAIIKSYLSANGTSICAIKITHEIKNEGSHFKANYPFLTLPTTSLHLLAKLPQPHSLRSS